MKIIVHPGQLKTRLYSAPDRDAVLYGDYESYINALGASTSRDDIIITSPGMYDLNCKKFSEMVPFKVASSQSIIPDWAHSLHWEEGFKYVGAGRLLKLLEKKKVGKEEKIGLCGDQLWSLDSVIINKVPSPPRLILGDVARYYNTLFQAGYKPKIIRELCYPTKEPEGFTGTF